MLKTAFRHLHHKHKTFCDLEYAPIGHLALTVALRYMDKITQPKSTIPGELGQVIRRHAVLAKRVP